MSVITQLNIYNFRNLQQISLSLSSGLNIFSGKNASGKTSLLEALSVLSTGRSFRSQRLEDLIQHQQTSFLISAALQNPHHHQIGIKRNINGLNLIKLDNKSINSIFPLAALLPIQLLTPHQFHLLELGPEEKRKFIDWGVFHVEPSFLEHWRIFRRALKQRNAALKNNISTPDSIALWDQSLADAAHQITTFRQHYCMQLFPLITAIAEELLDSKNLRFSFIPGCEADTDYLKILQEQQSKDRWCRFTRLGPHRADLKVFVNQFPAEEILSRGQQKLLVSAMLIAQGLLLKNTLQKNTVYLMDDLLAELDTINREKILSLLSTLGMQVIATAVDNTCLQDLAMDYELFHVEHGEIFKTTEQDKLSHLKKKHVII